MIDQAAVIGDGQMGTVLAILLADQGIAVRLWSRSPEHVKSLKSRHENQRYLPGVPIPAAVSFTDDPASVLSGAGLIVTAVPCQFLRGVWARFTDSFDAATPIVSVTKGLEIETLLRPTQVIAELSPAARLGVLSGPNIAGELARRLPATMVAASDDDDLATLLQRTFSTGWLRVYTNDDMPGVELAGAMKNVIALAAGMLDGLAAGDNAKAALVTRGLVEMTRLGEAMGARRETFAGLAGLGDLVTTCISPVGRNRSAGAAIGRGDPVQRVIDQTPSVIEGIPTTRGVRALARQFGVDMPIVEAVHAVLFDGKDVIAALTELMGRGLRRE